MPSTVIRTFDYDPQRSTLTVTFVTGKRYLYLDVPQAEFEGMTNAFAKGRYFNAHIRRYAWRELPRADEE